LQIGPPANRSKQRGFEQKEAKVTKGKGGLAFRDGPSTNSRLIVLRSAGSAFDGEQKANRIEQEEGN
jgi:hypothetical protein